MWIVPIIPILAFSSVLTEGGRLSGYEKGYSFNPVSDVDTYSMPNSGTHSKNRPQQQFTQYEVNQVRPTNYQQSQIYPVDTYQEELDLGIANTYQNQQPMYLKNFLRKQPTTNNTKKDALLPSKNTPKPQPSVEVEKAPTKPKREPHPQNQTPSYGKIIDPKAMMMNQAMGMGGMGMGGMGMGGMGMGGMGMGGMGMMGMRSPMGNNMFGGMARNMGAPMYMQQPGFGMGMMG